MKFIALIIFIGFLAQGASAHVQLGDYQGVDGSGRFCDLFLGPPFGSEYMGFFWLVNANGSFRVVTAYDPQPTTAGKIANSDDLMADGWDHGQPFYHHVDGAPIGAPVIMAKYSIQLKGEVPVRLDFATDYGNSVCKHLKYIGPYRP